LPSLSLAHCNEVAAAGVVPDQIDDELHFRRPCFAGNKDMAGFVSWYFRPLTKWFLEA
jgi:hypothetical protein